MQHPEPDVNLLAEGTRRRIFELLVPAPAGLTVDEVATAVDVHRTVAAGHLRRLVAGGLVSVASEPVGRGRPRHRFRALGAAEFSVPVRRTGLLARLLGQALRDLGAAGEGSARRAGAEYGATGGALTALGGGYTVADGGRLLAEPCVFRETCLEVGPLVCAVHASIIGAALGAGCRPLGRTPGGCAYAVAGASIPA